jgi:hypothetical protein
MEEGEMSEEDKKSLCSRYLPKLKFYLQVFPTSLLHKSFSRSACSTSRAFDCGNAGKRRKRTERQSETSRIFTLKET